MKKPLAGVGRLFGPMPLLACHPVVLKKREYWRLWRKKG